MRTIPFLLGALLLLPALLAPSSMGDAVGDAPVFQRVDERREFAGSILAARGGEMLAAVVNNSDWRGPVAPAGLYLLEASGATLLHELPMSHPGIAVDGAGNAYLQTHSDAGWALYRHDGEILTPVAAESYHPVFGPDGKLYNCYSGKFFRIDHGRETEMLPGACQWADWAFAPDGTLYALRQAQGWNTSLVRVDVETGASTHIAIIAGDARALAFDLDGAVYAAYQPCCQSQRYLARLDPAHPVLEVVSELPFHVAFDMAFAGSRLWISYFNFSASGSTTRGVGYLDLDVVGFGGFQPAPLDLPPLPDLVVRSIEVVPVPMDTPAGPVRIEPYEKRVIRATIANIGGGDAAAFNVTRYVFGQTSLMSLLSPWKLDEQVEGLSAGSEVVVELMYETKGRVGRQRIDVHVDSPSRVLESDEHNNQLRTEDMIVAPL